MDTLSSLSLDSNSKPNYLAPFTSANSSGEDELYVPFFLSMIIVWQTARKSRTRTKD